jgi:hypothetical protein
VAAHDPAGAEHGALYGAGHDRAAGARPSADAAGPELRPLRRRVLSVVHDPTVERPSERRLSQVMGWHDPDDLAAQYVRDVAQASRGLVEYEVVERIGIGAFPAKVDGFSYDAGTYLRCWRAGRGFHEPDGVDYHAVLSEVEAAEKVDAGAIDEVWLFGFPYSGYYESMMAGPGAFWCNAPPLPPGNGRGALAACRRRFVVMGFNFERDVGCMLENLGHRAESIMAQVYAGTRGPANAWERFTRYDQIAPGRASAGNVHFAPNSAHDYDWGNPRPVPSDCDDWLEYPHLTGRRRLVDCRDWGGGDMRLHHLWWLERLPHAPGWTTGILNNWWAYIADPNLVEV